MSTFSHFECILFSAYFIIQVHVKLCSMTRETTYMRETESGESDGLARALCGVVATRARRSAREP